jgi:hypothetical protein
MDGVLVRLAGPSRERGRGVVGAAGAPDRVPAVHPGIPVHAQLAPPGPALPGRPVGGRLRRLPEGTGPGGRGGDRRVHLRAPASVGEELSTLPYWGLGGPLRALFAEAAASGRFGPRTCPRKRQRTGRHEQTAAPPPKEPLHLAPRPGPPHRTRGPPRHANPFARKALQPPLPRRPLRPGGPTPDLRREGPAGRLGHGRSGRPDREHDQKRRQIWTELMHHHDYLVTYDSIRHYIRYVRPRTPPARAPLLTSSLDSETGRPIGHS